MSTAGPAGNHRSVGSAAPSELATALHSCRGALIGIGAVSSVGNVLMLTAPFFMLEIYDRVLPGRSVPTLVGLTILAGTLYAFQGMLEWIRARVLVRIGMALDEAVSFRVFDALVRMPLKARTTGDGIQPLRDLDQVRAFLSSTGPLALFDFPWVPLYLGICFLFHPWIGVLATSGAMSLVVITFLTEIRTRKPVQVATRLAAARNAFAEACRRNAEVLQAMGMAGRAAALWGRANEQYMTHQRNAADVAGGFGALSKVLRIALQSAVLALGAYLVIHQEATAGIIIASSILTSRALAPVEVAIANWRGFLAARQSWRRLSELLRLLPMRETPMTLPSPHVSLVVRNLFVTPPGGRTFVLEDVNFALNAGSALGIIGPSAAGKSSLARALVGVWTPVRGAVRLDGAVLSQLDAQSLGRHLGYLPQDVELFDGTIAENIARFDPEADSAAIIEAAAQAGVHDMILRLSEEGYDMQIGEAGTALSAGQRQRIALARALYGNPFLVVLDEPTSNLDAEGEAALTKAILSVRARGGIAIVVAHRPNTLAGVDLVLVLVDGKARDFGPKDEVLGKMRPTPQLVTPAPARVSPDRGSRAP